MTVKLTSENIIVNQIFSKVNSLLNWLSCKNVEGSSGNDIFLTPKGTHSVYPQRNTFFFLLKGVARREARWVHISECQCQSDILKSQLATQFTIWNDCWADIWEFLTACPDAYSLASRYQLAFYFINTVFLSTYIHTYVCIYIYVRTYICLHLCICMYIYVYIHTYVCIYIYVRTYIYTYTYMPWRLASRYQLAFYFINTVFLSTYIHTYVCIFIYVRTYICLHLCICMYIYVYIHKYVCIYIYVRTYIYTYTYMPWRLASRYQLAFYFINTVSLYIYIDTYVYIFMCMYIDIYIHIYALNCIPSPVDTSWLFILSTQIFFFSIYVHGYVYLEYLHKFL